jgi:hypothetical protein
MHDPNPMILRRKKSNTSAGPWKHCYDECAMRRGCEAWSVQIDHQDGDGVIYCTLYSGAPTLEAGPGGDGVVRTSGLMPGLESEEQQKWRRDANRKNALQTGKCFFQSVVRYTV